MKLHLNCRIFLIFGAKCLDENACGLTLYIKKIIKFSMDAETKKLREELGLKHILNKKALRPEARGKTGAEIIRDLRTNMKRF